MNLRRDEIETLEYSVDIGKSISMLGKIAAQIQWKVGEKQDEETPIIIRWDAELRDMNLNNLLGKFTSNQQYYIKVINRDSLIQDVATIFTDSQINAQELFELESKKRNFKLSAWDVLAISDVYMQDVLTDLGKQLPKKNPS